MANELVKSPANTCTLYELEDNLQALANSIALAEEEPTRQLILDEIGQALRKTKEKRDTVVAFLRHCELQQKFADAEIERIEKRKAFIASVEEQLESYVVQLIEQFAPARSERGSAPGGEHLEHAHPEESRFRADYGSKRGAFGLQARDPDDAGLRVGGAAQLRGLGRPERIRVAG